METKETAITPTGVASGFLDARPVHAQWDSEGPHTVPTEYTPSDECIVCVDLRDHPEVHHIARKLWFVDRTYVFHNGFLSVGRVFKNCVIVDISKAFSFKVDSGHTIPEEEIHYLNELRKSHYLVMPTKYLLGKFRTASNSPVNSEFYGINYKRFYGNILTSENAEYYLDIIGIIQNGKWYDGKSADLLHRGVYTPRINNTQEDFYTLEAEFFAKINAILDLV
jgi:hypothetical protein